MKNEKKISVITNSRLTNEVLLEIEDMVIRGVSPEDIASVVGISTSTVHLYKREMKSAGFNFPDVTGQRPKGLKNRKKENNSDSQDESSWKETRLLVNGIEYTISGYPSSVSISKNCVEIKY